jgi:hypothetical protein
VAEKKSQEKNKTCCDTCMLSTKRTNVFLLELAGQVTLDEGGLANTAITNKNKFELRNFCLKSMADKH